MPVPNEESVSCKCMSRKGELSAGNSIVDDERRGKAQALGIPALYDPRYRVSCTLALVDKEGYRSAIRSLERKLTNMPNSPPGWNASEVENLRCRRLCFIFVFHSC